MTEFERIKNMDVVDFAMYINALQLQAIDDYEKGFFPKGIFDNVAMLEAEVLKKPSLEEKVQAAQSKINSGQRRENEVHRGDTGRE